MARSKKKTWLNDKKQQKKLSEAVERVCTADKNIYTVQFSKKENLLDKGHGASVEKEDSTESRLTNELSSFMTDLEALRAKHGVDVLAVGAAFDVSRVSNKKGLVQFTTLHGKNGHLGALIRELKKKNTEAVLEKIISDYKSGEIDPFSLQIAANKNQMVTFKLGQPSAIVAHADRELVDE